MWSMNWMVLKWSWKLFQPSMQCPTVAIVGTQRYWSVMAMTRIRLCMRRNHLFFPHRPTLGSQSDLSWICSSNRRTIVRIFDTLHLTLLILSLYQWRINCIHTGYSESIQVNLKRTWYQRKRIRSKVDPVSPSIPTNIPMWWLVWTWSNLKVISWRRR